MSLGVSVLVRIRATGREPLHSIRPTRELWTESDLWTLLGRQMLEKIHVCPYMHVPAGAPAGNNPVKRETNGEVDSGRDRYRETGKGKKAKMKAEHKKRRKR